MRQGIGGFPTVFQIHPDMFPELNVQKLDCKVVCQKPYLSSIIWRVYYLNMLWISD
jgi:hypothetical protein